MNTKKKVDNYSILIVAKYLQQPQDYINLVCVCKNYKKTLKKFRYNPIPVHSTKLFPLMQTQYLYNPTETKIKDIELYRICYPIPYHEYVEYQKEGNIKCSKVYFDGEDGENFDGTFPEVVHSIGIQALIDNEMKELTLPTFITSLEENCLVRMTNLTSLELSPHLNSIPFGMVQLCYNLQNIIIPTTITSIGSYAFKICTSLKDIIIPNSVSFLGEAVFLNCIQLSSITLSTSLKIIQAETFKNCVSLTYVQKHSKIVKV